MKKLLILGLTVWNPLSACKTTNKGEASDVQAASTPSPDKGPILKFESDTCLLTIDKREGLLVTVQNKGTFQKETLYIQKPILDLFAKGFVYITASQDPSGHISAKATKSTSTNSSVPVDLKLTAKDSSFFGKKGDSSTGGQYWDGHMSFQVDDSSSTRSGENLSTFEDFEVGTEKTGGSTSSSKILGIDYATLSKVQFYESNSSSSDTKRIIFKTRERAFDCEHFEPVK
ncbi:MAG: hypothetical protein NTZ90_09665 [Proteobacteria bacterium]|nr:hypothetical protein [Pseudomonadota bacterium]